MIRIGVFGVMLFSAFALHATPLYTLGGALARHLSPGKQRLEGQRPKAKMMTLRWEVSRNQIVYRGLSQGADVNLRILEVNGRKSYWLKGRYSDGDYIFNLQPEQFPRGGLAEVSVNGVTRQARITMTR